MTATRKKDYVLEVHSRQLVQGLVGDIRAGFGLSPFLGSGCSSSSGILMGQEFSDYLAWTVYRCVRERSSGGSGERERWNLRTQGWPDLPKPEELNVTRRWALRHFRKIAAGCGFKVNVNQRRGTVRSVTRADGSELTPDRLAAVLGVPFVPPILRDPKSSADGVTDANNLKQLHRAIQGRGVREGGLLRAEFSPTSEDGIIERAIRSLFDWRATLHFLSTLQLSPDNTTVYQTQSDPAIIDEFNVHISRGRRPNLVHTMLAHLRQPARLRTIFTTNFDTLIEEAFAEQHFRLEVISVTRSSTLPSPNIVHARDTLIKLHGTLTETRADFSLDDPPTEQDCRTFFNYVRGRFPLMEPEVGVIPAQLLVGGQSGNDPRSVQLIKYVLDHDLDARVYWVCHNADDRACLSRIFPEKAYEGKVICTVTERLDLLLYELHQALCLCLPPGGATYPTNHNLPPQPDAPLSPVQTLEPTTSRGEPPGVDDILDALELRVNGRSRRSMASNVRTAPSPSTDDISGALPPCAVVLDGKAGVLRAMSAVFNHSSASRIDKVWLELEDFRDTESLAHELFQTMAIRRGIFQLGHVELCPVAPPAGDEQQWREHVAAITPALGINPERWLIALYGRHEPGCCSGWIEGDSSDAINDLWDESEQKELAAFLRAMSRARFRIMYAPYSADVVERKQTLGREVQRAIERARRLSGVAHRSCITQTETRTRAAFAKAELGGWKDVWITPASDDDEAVPVFCGKLDAIAEYARIPDDDKAAPFVDAPAREAGAGGSVDGVGGCERIEKERKKSDRLRLERYAAVHAASLFRHSRHPTALLSDAVVRASSRFHAFRADRDLERNQLLEDWCHQVSKNSRPFYYKPGGLFWADQDILIGTRELTEKLVESTLHGQPPLRARAARAHFMIAEWYLGAFQISGHASTLMEAAYHFFQCVLRSRDAVPAPPSEREEAECKLHWWRLGAYELIKTLRCGRPVLSFWFGKAQIREWFGKKARDRVVKEVLVAGTEILERQSAKDVEAKLVESLLEAELLCLGVGVEDRRGSVGEGGAANGKAAAASDEAVAAPGEGTSESDGRHAQKKCLSAYRSLLGLALPATNASNDHAEVLSPPDFDSAAEESWESTAKAAITPRIQALLGNTPKTGVATKPLHDVLDAWRMDPADALLSAKVVFSALLPDPETGTRELQLLVTWTGWLSTRAERQEYAHGQHDRSASASGQGTACAALPLLDRSEAEVLQPWVRVTVFAEAAERAARRLPPGLERFAERQHAEALGLHGVALARLQRFFEAHRRLNQSHGLLMSSGAPLADLGTLSLRRAEVFLLEAQFATDLRNAFERGRAIPKPPPRHCGEVVGQIAKALEEIRKQRNATEQLKAQEQAKQSDKRASEQSQPREPLVAPQLNMIDVWLRAHFADRWSDAEALQRHGSAAKEPGAPQKKGAIDPARVIQDLERVAVARCDDAWKCLEHAEDLLGGRTRAVELWSSLRVLQLQVFSVVPKPHKGNGARTASGAKHQTPRARFIHPRDMDIRRRLDTCVTDGIAAAPADEYGKRRLLDHYVRARFAAGNTDERARFLAEALGVCLNADKDWRVPSGSPLALALVDLLRHHVDEQGHTKLIESLPGFSPDAAHSTNNSKSPAEHLGEALRNHLLACRRHGSSSASNGQGNVKPHGEERRASCRDVLCEALAARRSQQPSPKRAWNLASAHYASILSQLMPKGDRPAPEDTVPATASAEPSRPSG
jgi:hypothetical protein